MPKRFDNIIYRTLIIPNWLLFLTKIILIPSISMRAITQSGCYLDQRDPIDCNDRIVITPWLSFQQKCRKENYKINTPHDFLSSKHENVIVLYL